MASVSVVRSLDGGHTATLSDSDESLLSACVSVMWRLASALLLAAAAPQLGEGEEGAGSHRYCIVGGGPGGLQLGQFLLSAGRDYVIFKRGTGPGFFFERFPIHRQLISLNKRHTGRDNPEFSEPASTSTSLSPY